uniref:Uncharacterized protein n=1 Tax=Anguilla anguilla TaxID=7936 RepID=A0A0E9VBI7_ANGAN
MWTSGCGWCRCAVRSWNPSQLKPSHPGVVLEHYC